IMMGYWGKPEETGAVLRSGRLHTGDMATVDEDGYIYIMSRRTEMIKSGAHRIAPREIEEVLLKNPSVF
ncbi:MAG: AMP-binding protein, partial [Deltaproteobacteria bacterium]|nr:AMP-binding protein [Deltaproteobacteria bacterium]